MINLQGQNFLSASLSGFAGSLGASGWSSIVGSSGASMIAFGALSGGVASELSGGNFWQGAVTGGIVAGLNHAMHRLGGPGDGKKKKYTFKDAKARWQSRKGGVVDVDASTIDWSKADLSEAGNEKGTYRIRLDGKHRVNDDDALVHGTVTIEPVSGKRGYYQIAMDGETGCRCGRYDFDIKHNQWFTKKGFIRNMATFTGKIVNGMQQYYPPKGVLMIPVRTYVGGAPFTIRYHGIFKIGK